MKGALSRGIDAVCAWAARPDGSVTPARAAVLLAAGYAAFAATYLPINVLSIRREAHVLYLPGEARVPFVPEFEFLYVLGYGLPVLVVLAVRRAATLRRLLVAFPLTLMIAYTTYLVFPVYLARPVIEPDSLATFLLSLEYRDPSYNHFPSLHVATAWLIYLACRSGVSHPRLLLALVTGVTVSTVFVKQHYVVDLAYGVALARAAWAWAGRRVGALRLAEAS